ncbi:hypothetical protein, partial [Klebsiella pneumoniae]|uniref:hypothetical protein n=1 Tax=Klebsiella pneumoniae TaxID=573 RepID=UPI001C70969B
ICSPMTSLKTSIKTITYLSDIGCLEIHGASLAALAVIAADIIAPKTIALTLFMFILPFHISIDRKSSDEVISGFSICMNES